MKRNSNSIRLFAGAVAILLFVNLLTACNQPNPTIQRYADLLREEGATLNLYWPANPTIANWIKGTLIPGYKQFVKDTYGVDMTVKLVSTGPSDNSFLPKLQNFEKTYKNGNTFYADVAREVASIGLLEAGREGWLMPVLSNPYAFPMSNVSHINQQGRDIFTFNGDEKTLYAVPFYQPTISFFYNKNRISPAELPRTLSDPLAWVKNHPRKFTYGDPTDTSSAGIGSGIMFVLAVMHAEGDSESTDMSRGIQYLKELQPYIIPEGEGTSGMRNLMKHDDVWLMPYWNNDGLSEAQSFNIPFMQNYFPPDKMAVGDIPIKMPVRNTPITIPTHAQHKLAALIFMNYALSDETQRTMAVTIRQFPANVDDAVLHNLPPNTFGDNINIDEIANNDTFFSYNSTANIQWIKTLTNMYPHLVLGR